MNEIIAQVLYVINVILYIASLNSSKKVLLLILNFASNLFFIAHYILLGGLTGASTAIVTTTYLVVIFFLEKYNKENLKLPFCIVFMILAVVAGILTWEGIFSIFPIFSSLFYLVGLNFTNIVKVKVSALLSLSFNLVYLISVRSYVGSIFQFGMIISAIIGIIRSVKSSKKPSTKVAS